jgi:pentatricopeptide repeat protein
MPQALRLTLTDYLDTTRWRWVLHDSRDRFLADHDVRLDPTTREYGGFRDLSTYLEFHKPIHPPEKQLEELGAWIGEKVFGGLREKLWARRTRPAVAVQVVVPATAKDLLSRPFELARFADGTSFGEAGIRFVYGLDGTQGETFDKEPVQKAVRILAAFSLPVRAKPLNLRHERYGLQQLVRSLNAMQRLAVELRVIRYGATRETLREALEEAEGWDIVHLSGHGQQGELLLEDNSGGSDKIGADELGKLLELSRSRLKLLILDACYSGVGSQADAREQIGLDRLATRQEGTDGETVAQTTGTVLPSLAVSLSQQLDCAALAMRYPVGDAFATELMLALYEKILDKRRTLPGALHLALDDALASDIPRPPLSPITPILVGLSAADLQLQPPAAAPEVTVLPTVGLSIGFPPEPERFVGRLQPMLRASQALAPGGSKRGVLFYGMPGAGKTSCALELAYRHEQGRFQGYIWHRAPEAGTDISSALFNLMQDIQTQLNAPELGLTTALDQPDRFRQITLPRLRARLKESSLLLVLDNLETLLTDSDHWLDPLWGDVMAALLAHDGPSRVVLTCRRVPADLENHPKVQVNAIHALSFPESVLLARELPNLKRLFDDEAGRTLLQKTLRVVQGHPKLMELADSVASDREVLGTRVAAAEEKRNDRADTLDVFFAIGVAHEGESRQQEADFLPALRCWTDCVVNALTPTARLLFAFLCRMEPADRKQDIVEANWRYFLTRLGEGHAVATRALAQPEQGLLAALAALEGVGLVGVGRSALDPKQIEALGALLASQVDPGVELDTAVHQRRIDQFKAQDTTYTIHPCVAESARAAADLSVPDAADIQLGNYFIAVFQYGLKTEMEGGGSLVVDSARRAAPYLLRQGRWNEATDLLDRMLRRDSSPDNLAFALPLLRRMAAADAGTERDLMAAGVLAGALSEAGRTAEAEPMLRDVMTRSATQGDFRVASAVAGDLFHLLRRNGRLEEALKVADQKAGYTAQAGLGRSSRPIELHGIPT